MTTKRIVFLFFAAAATIYAGTKHQTGHVDYPYTDPERRYLYDNGSYVTNDYVHIAFTRAAVVPDSADLFGYVRPISSTNDDDWVEFLVTTFDRFDNPTNLPWAGAISNNFQLFTTYTPGPVVHTNGVAVILWQRDFSHDNRFLATIRTGIYTNGFRIAPTPAVTNGAPILVTSSINPQNESNE